MSSYATAIGSAFIRIRPDTTGFRSETQAGVKRAIAGAAAITGVSLGIAEVIRQTKEAIQVERERQLITAQADTALRAAGQSWQEYGGHIDEVIQKQSQLSAFDDEDLLKSFTLLFRATKDVNSALDLNALAANVARGRNLDLVRTAQLLVRVQAGQVGSLRRLGIQIDKNATGQEALAAVQKQYAGAAVTYANSQAGAQARLNKVWDDTQELIGGELAPTIAEYQRKLAEWLNTANETGRTQQVLDETLGQGKDAVKGVADAMQTLHDITAPLVELLGGTERVVKLLIIAMAARRVAAFSTSMKEAAGSFGLVASASTKATAVVEANAAATTTAVQAESAAVVEAKTAEALAAERAAARMARAARIAQGAASAILIGTTLFGDKVPKGKGGGVTGGDLLSGANAAAFGFLVTKNPGVAVGAFVASTALAKDARQKNEVQTKFNALTWAQQQGIRRQLGESRWEDYLALFDLKPKPMPIPKGQTDYAGPHRPNPVPAADSNKPTRPTYKQVTARLDAFDETQTNARIQKDQARERRSLVAEKAYIEARLKDARLSVAQRRDLKGKLEQTQSSIDSIDDAIQSARDAAAAKAKTDREQARAAADKAWDTRVSRRLGQLERQRREAAARDDVKAQQQILAQEEAFLKRMLALAKSNRDRRDKLLDEISNVHVEQSNLRKGQAGTSTGIDKRYAELERQRREAAARDDLAEQKRILDLEERHLKTLIANAKAGSARQERLKNELTTVHERQAKLNKKASTETQDVFAQAAAIFRDYGGYIDARTGGPLSVQGARALVAAGILGGTSSAAQTVAQTASTVTLPKPPDERGTAATGPTVTPQRPDMPGVQTVADKQQQLGEQQLAEERRQSTLLQQIAVNTRPRVKPTPTPGSKQSTVRATGDSYLPSWTRGL